LILIGKAYHYLLSCKAIQEVLFEMPGRLSRRIVLDFEETGGVG